MMMMMMMMMNDNNQMDLECARDNHSQKKQKDSFFIEFIEPATDGCVGWFDRCVVVL
jgi:hypothetical protein